MKTEKGDRKLTLAKGTANYLLAGLLVTLVAAGYFKMDTAICVQAFAIYVAGVVGKDCAFVYGNAKEHASAAVIATGKPEAVKQ